MAKKGKHKININLSSKGKQSVEKVVYGWTIDAGRGIIVLIELIALLALGFRFYIDSKIVDLHDEINRQEVILKAKQADEKDFRSIQARLENIKTTTEQTDAKIQLMNQVLDAISGGTLFSTNLSINNNTIIIDGSTFSAQILNNFLETLKGFESVAAISIDEMVLSDSGIRFQAKIDIKDLAKK